MLITFVTFVIVLGIMILVHEFGHFAAAKLFGVKVEVFSIGFGKRLVGFRRGETDYRIAALPLGGYVKMAGENPMDARSGAPGEFTSHPRWQRLIIAAAGPAMNIILAIVLLTGVYMVHYDRPAFLDKKPRVSYVEANSPAAAAGVVKGDVITQIDDIDNPTWEDVYFKSILSPGRQLKVTVQRDGKLIPLSVTPEKNSEGQGRPPGWIPEQPNVVGSLEPGMPADKAGLRIGDTISAVNGKPISSTDEMIEILQQTKGAPVELTVQRAGATINVALTPVLRNEGGEERYRVGMIPAQTQPVKLPFGEALNTSLRENAKSSMMILKLVQGMVRREVSIKQMEGPIGIARVSGRAVRQEGWVPILVLMAVISLNLGVFNLFPIPILDGGVILMLLIEGVMRRDISLQIKERVYQVAFVFLVLFAVVVIYNDIIKALPGLVRHLP